jgi:diguanylate cyclase (GGDEF)-like protein
MTKVHHGHVLVTDDSLTVRMMLKSQLEEQGYQVSLCDDGETCMAFLQQTETPPDVVLLDLVLPGVDGIHVLNWIKSRSDDVHIPVILLTALGAVDDLVRGLDQGADDYIAKPFEGEELLARVRAQIRLKRLQDELSGRNAELEAADQEKDRLLSQLAAKNKQLAVMATTDTLTGVSNRGSIEQFLDNEASRAKRFGTDLAVAMVDIDHFKRVNDTYGHPVGDRVIREVSRAITDTIRTVDQVGRYGGEEFLVVLPGADLEGAMILGERVRETVAALYLEPQGIAPTLSCGVAVWDPGVTSWNELVSAADQALYEAKRNGRNRVCAHNPESVGHQR